ncbi:MAG TPA: DUF934 domain-containing protein [Rhizomicrobium sp.]|jgi:uncharacterized protein (DUF934 family)
MPPIPDDAIIPLERFKAEREALFARNEALGVRLTSAQSPEELGEDVHRLSVIVYEFPVFRDGRPYSWARMLRTRMGYKGELRASGHFLFDQLAFLTRVGFDAFDGVTDETLARARAEITDVYQPGADRRRTIPQLRQDRGG